MSNKRFPHGTKRWQPRGKTRTHFKECGHRGFGGTCHRCAYGDKLLGVAVGDDIRSKHGKELVRELWNKYTNKPMPAQHTKETVERLHAEGERLIRTGN